MTPAAAQSQELDTIYRAMRGELRAFIGRRVRDSAAADDLLHDVFLKVHAGRDGVRDPARLQAWVYRITRNVIHDWHRRRAPAEPMSPELERDLAAPLPEFRALSDLAPSIRACVERLPERYREALVASDLQRIPQTELARQLGMSHSGLKSRVQRARRMLHEMFLACCRLEFDARGGLSDFHPLAPCVPCHDARAARDAHDDPPR